MKRLIENESIKAIVSFCKDMNSFFMRQVRVIINDLIKKINFFFLKDTR